MVECGRIAATFLQKIRTIRFVVASVVLMAAMTVVGQSSDASAARAEIKKVSRVMVWEPGAAGKQVPLWPDGLAILRPDSGDRPEETGNGSRLVAGRPWHWRLMCRARR